MASAPTLTWKQYQKLPENQRSRPLTPAEYAALPDRSEGAPVNFNGPVFPNPDHIQPQLDSDSAIPVTRLPNGVSFNNGVYRGGAEMQTVGAKMSTQPAAPPQTLPADFNQWDSAPATLPADFNKWDQPRANTQSAPAQPSVMQVLTQPTAKTDKEYLGYTGPAGVVGATLHGLNDVAQATKDAIKGAYDSFGQPPQDKTETVVSALSPAALPIYRMLRGMGHSAADATHIAAAVHDINQSADPTGSYLEAGEKTAAQGAGQALVALGTEGAIEGAPAAARGIAKGAKAAAGVIRDVATPENIATVAGGAAGAAAGHAVGAPFEMGAGGAMVGKALGKAIAKRMVGEGGEVLDATGENKPFAGGADEPPPQKVLDATGENKPFAGGVDEAVQQALQEKGPNAPLSEVAQRTQEIKAAQATPAQPNPRLAADLANWQPPPELGVTSAPDYGAAAKADVERRMGGALPRGMAERRIPSPIEETPDVKDIPREEWDASRFIEPQIEGTPRPDLMKQLNESLEMVQARKPPQSVGSLTAAMQDTASFKQALQEKGPNAPLSDVAQRAQEIKAAKAKTGS